MTYSRDDGTSTPNLAGLIQLASGFRINDGTFVLTRCDLFDGPPVRPSVTPLSNGHGGFSGTSFYDSWEFQIEGYLTVPVLADVWAAKDDLSSAFNLNAGLIVLTLDTAGWSAARQVTAKLNGPIQFVEPTMNDKLLPDRDFVIPMVAPDPRIYSSTLHSTTVTSGGTSLSNAGNMPTPFTVRFNGPQTGPLVLTDPDGNTITVSASPTSGHYVEVTTRGSSSGATAVDDLGASKFSSVTDWSAAVIAAGSDTWTATNGGGAGTTVVSHRDAWS